MIEIIKMIILLVIFIIVSLFYLGATIILLKLMWIEFKEKWNNLI